VLALVVGFSGVVTWPCDLLEGNISAIDTPVYEDIKEVSSFVAIVSSLDVPLWRLSGVLQQDADRLVSQAWREAFVPVEEKEILRHGGGGGSTTDSYFWSCWVVSIRYYTHCVGVSFQGYLRVGSIWWDQHRFGNNALGGVFQFGSTFTWREMRPRGGFHRAILHY
jgi:hypothetical protein